MLRNITFRSVSIDQQAEFVLVWVNVLVRVIANLVVIKTCTGSYTCTVRFWYPEVVHILTHSVNLPFGLNGTSKINVRFGRDSGFKLRPNYNSGSEDNMSSKSLYTWGNITAFHKFTAFGALRRSRPLTGEWAELPFQALEYLHPSTDGIFLKFEREQPSFRSWQNFVRCSFCKKSCVTKVMYINKNADYEYLTCED